MRIRNLLLLSAGAIAGAVAGFGRESDLVARIASAVGVLVLGLAGVIQQRYLTPAETQSWMSSRHASERLKAAVLRELVAASAGSEPDSALAHMVDQTQKDHGNLLAPAGAAESSSLPVIRSLDDYVRLRVNEQADWHRTKASGLQARSDRLRTLELAATVLGVVASALGAIVSDVFTAPIIGMCTTIAAALAAHLASSKLGVVAADYVRTATRLETLAGRVPREGCAVGEALGYVDTVEAVLAEQNSRWLAALGSE
ncbi:MAG: SLATT domain-containing protein [Ilumatobacteraceae bacterium]